MRGIAFCVIFFSWSVACMAEDSVWRVVYNSFPPFTFTDANGHATGYGNDLIRALAARKGVEVDFTEVDNPGEAMALLDEGRADLSPNLVETPERSAVVRFSPPHASVQMYAYALRDRADVVSMAWPNDVRIGVVEGAFSEFLARRQDGARVVPIRTHADSLLQLVSGEVDAVIQSDIAFATLVNAFDTRRRFEVVSPTLADVNLSVAVSRQSPEVFLSLSEALSQFVASDQYLALRNQYLSMGHTWTTQTVVSLLIASSAMVLLISLLLLAFHRQRAQRALMLSMQETARSQIEAAERLRSKNTELLRKNQEMEDLVYVVSHDLSSPLVSISGFAKTAYRASAEGDAERVQALLDRVQSNVGSMSGLIEGILAVSRISRCDAQKRPVLVSEIIPKVVDALASNFEAAEARLVVSGDAELFTDPDLVRQALQNLMENALRYGCQEPGSIVRVLVQKDGRAVRLGISDSGPGFPDVGQDRLFEMFQRGANKVSKGSGLGLAIVSRIADRLGADVTIENRPGEGACVWLRLDAYEGSSLEAAA